MVLGFIAQAKKVTDVSFAPGPYFTNKELKLDKTIASNFPHS